MSKDKPIVMTEVPAIVSRLCRGKASVSALMKKYHTSYGAIMCAVLSVISEPEYAHIRHRPLSHGGVRSLLKHAHNTYNAGTQGIVNPGGEKSSLKSGPALRRILKSNKRRNYLAGDGRPIPKYIQDTLEPLQQNGSWWQCVGCAYRFEGEPPFSCSKCGSLLFVIITQRNRVYG